MKQYYLSKLVQDDVPPGGLQWRPKIARFVGVNVAAVIPVDPVTGKPLKDWCLCIVAARNHAQFRNDPDIDDLPDFPPDAKVSAMQKATKDRMMLNMRKRGIDDSVVDGADGYREVIRHIGRATGYPDFNEDNFDVADL
jgi:hypothetical protein